MALAVVLEGGLAEAHSAGGTGGPPPASELPPGPVKRMILDVQKRLVADDRDPELVEHPIAEALRAAERGRGAVAAGDQVHGGMFDKLAERWAKVATAVLEAVTREAAAKAEAERLQDLEQKVERAETLLSEQQARLGRLEKQVERAEARVEAAEGAARAAERDRTAPKKPKPAENTP